MTENFRTESVLFDVVEVSLPFNAILGRPALYQFMAVAHYGYLVLKMSSPNDVLKIQGDRDAGACALEKLQALAAAREATEEPGGQDPTPSSSRQRGSVLAPGCNPLARKTSPQRPSRSGLRLDRLPVSRVIWTVNRNSRLSPSSGLMSMCLPGNRHKCLGSLWR
jgi:hypothetical protein